MGLRRLPIRVRLALWYLASFFVVLVLVGSGTFYAMRLGIRDEFDRDLKIRLAGLKSFLDNQAPRSWDKIRHELQEHVALRPGGELLQISDQEGNWLFQSDSMRHLGVSRPVDRALPKPVYNTVSRNGIPVRIVSAFQTIRGKRLGIQLGQSLEESTELIERFGWILVAALPIVLLVAGVTGYWMAKRALKPVIAITEDARAIHASDISRRIVVPPANDELRVLSTTLNEMLDRLESAFRRVTQFTADASHELRTPLAVIRTTAELAVAERSQRGASEALASILEEAERTTDLLESLLVLARADSNARVRLEQVDLRVPARLASEQAELLASSKGVLLQFLTGNQPCISQGNMELLRRLFLILTDNAVKYTPSGGRVLISIVAGERSTQVEIRDTGVGILPEDLPHIFERFYRADKARDRSGGAGLGLSIADWIVRVHAATIQVASVVDHGTTFTLQFPNVTDMSDDQPAVLSFPIFTGIAG